LVAAVTPAPAPALPRWDSGETYLIMSQPMSAVVDKLRQGLSIRKAWPVSNISYDQGGAVLTGPDGSKLGARKVIVTASLAVLQSGRLGFSPALSADKLGALSRLRMGNAAKVCVWPHICGGYSLMKCRHDFRC
jgi:hypothetical protein